MDGPCHAVHTPRMTLHRLAFLKGLALVAGSVACSSSSTDPGVADTTSAGDTASGGDTATLDGNAGDTTTTADARPDGTASDGGDGNKCRYTAGPGYSFLDCGPGKVCNMSFGSGSPTCDAATDAGAPCGTIQCAGACACLDAAKSICDCVGGAVGPLSPPEIA